MAVLLTSGAVFLHIPKTGGIWVTETLRELGVVECEFANRHADVERARNPWRHRPRESARVARRLGPRWAAKLASAPMFCFVRNHLDWYESWWKYMQAEGWPHWGPAATGARWHPNAMLDGLGDPDFNRFVEHVADARPGYVTELFGWYTTPEVGFVGHTETLVDDLISILAELGVDADEDRIRSAGPTNVSPTGPEQIRWDPDLRDRVARLEHAGLVRHGYVQDGAE